MSELEKLKSEREDYIKKYIGDFNKPWDYKQKLAELDQEIMRLTNPT